MVDDQGSDFSMWIVKISHEHAPCTRPGLPSEVVNSENVTFQLAGFSGVQSLQVRYSNYEDQDKPQFISLPPVTVASDGTFTVEVKVGAYLTLSTITTSVKGNYTSPASSPSLPLPHSDNFNSYPVGQEAKWWTDQIGAYEIQPDSQNSSNFVMRQMVPQLPIGWSDAGSQGPFTLLGMKEWYDVAVETRFRLPSADAAGCVSTRSNQMWANGIVFCVGGNGVWNLTYQGPPQNGVFTEKPVATGTVRSPGVLTWHTLKLSTLETNATGWYDGQQVFSERVRPSDTGFAAIGMNTWLHVEFDDTHIEQVGTNWKPVQPCNPPTVGTIVKATPCQANGVTASNQLFDLTSNWAIVHKPTKLCVEAAASGTLQMAQCAFDSPAQSFVNDYTLIRNENQAMTLKNTSSHLVGTLDGVVTVSDKTPAGGWGSWAYYPNTFQLRNTYDTNTALGYPMCLSACA
ncbi:Galactocerebrosidase [Diplonema papillatum]|nr:Galactocerebrosidase [Diplonema papillatum]